MGFLLRNAFFCVTILAQAPASAGTLTLLYNPDVTTSPEQLKQWSEAELSKQRRPGDISLKELVEVSSASLTDTKLSEVDLFNFYDPSGKIIARVPRFLIWRDRVRLRFDLKSKTLSAKVLPTEGQLVPFAEMDVASLARVEMVNSWKQYPGIRLGLRTNPAAVRGEKLLTHNCLSCHSLPKNPPLNARMACGLERQALNLKHGDKWSHALDEYAHRGLQAYCEAASLSGRDSGSLSTR